MSFLKKIKKKLIINYNNSKEMDKQEKKYFHLTQTYALKIIINIQSIKETHGSKF